VLTARRYPNRRPSEKSSPWLDESRRDADYAPASMESAPTTQPSHRRAAIDWMRGLVMILMALDHASQMWNKGRLSADSIYLLDPMTMGPAWVPGSELDTAQFFTRWVTHLCAPTFLFLSGTSLAMSFEKRRAEGMTDRELDRHLLIRAFVILAFEGLFSLIAFQGVIILQVLSAIGFSMIAMVVLRRLPTFALLAIGFGWLAGSEWVIGFVQSVPVGEQPIWEVVLLLPGLAPPFYSTYPMTHWLAMMLLGWSFGRYLLALPNDANGSQQAEKLLLLSGLTALLAWAYIRSANAYGNMGLLRESRAIEQWLHMSKYPPAIVYSCMELGLMALLLVAFMRFERRLTKPIRVGNPLLVFGQTALFFYVLHFLMLGFSAVAITGGIMLRGLEETYAAAFVTLLVLYPVCVWFRALKRKHPTSFLQYI
jgi:uncharacterized membrane protein